MSFVAIITCLYGATGAAMLAAYVPQILSAARSANGARDVSLVTWAAWAFAALVSAVYACVVVHDIGFALMACGNVIGCTSVLAAAAWCRRATMVTPAVQTCG